MYGPAGRRYGQGTPGGYSAIYLYNALGQRAVKITGSAVTQYLYDLNGELLAEMDVYAHSGREYAFLNGQPLAAWHIEQPLPVTGQAAFSPPGGTYSDSVTVTLTPDSAYDSVYYTLDYGATFTEYTAPFVLTESTDVYAISTRAFYADSPAALASYTVTSGAQAASSGGGGASFSEPLSFEAATSPETGPLVRTGPVESPARKAIRQSMEAVRGFSQAADLRAALSVTPILDAVEREITPVPISTVPLTGTIEAVKGGLAQ